MEKEKTDDIVERLRDWAGNYEEGSFDTEEMLMREAADEIERLRAKAQSRYELLRECQSELRAMGATGLVETIDDALQPSGQTLPKPGRNDGGEPCGECHLQPGETCDICGAAQPSGQTRQVKLDRVNAIAEELLQQLDAFQSNQHHSFVTTQQMAREAATVIRLLQVALQPSGQTRAEIIEECAKVAEDEVMRTANINADRYWQSRRIMYAIRALAAQEKEKTQT